MSYNQKKLKSREIVASTSQSLYIHNLSKILKYIQSDEGNCPIRLNIVNLSNENIKFYWIDYDGNHQIQGTIAPNETRSQKTFATHPWLFTRSKGKICIFKPPAEQTHNASVNLTIMPSFEVSQKNQMQQNLYVANFHDILPHLHSIDTNIPMNLSINNTSDEYLQLFWIDQRGNHIMRGMQKPGESVVQKTYIGYPWIISRQNKIVCIYNPPKGLEPNCTVSITISWNFSIILNDAIQNGQFTKNLNYLLEDLRSKEATIPIRINVTNLSNEELTLFWVDNMGNEQLTCSVGHNETRSQKTFATHPWIISRHNGKVCIYDPPKLLAPNTIINITVLPNFDVVLKDLYEQGLYTTNLNHYTDNLKSHESYNPIKIKFVNRSQEEVVVGYQDERGDQFTKSVVKAGEGKSYNTFATHVWTVSRKSGRIAVYKASQLIEPMSKVKLTILWNFEMLVKDQLQKNLYTTNLDNMIKYIKSGEEKVPIQINFINDSTGPLKLFHIDRKGNLQMKANIDTGSCVNVSTFATNPWLLKEKYEYICLYNPQKTLRPNMKINQKVTPNYEIILDEVNNHFPDDFNDKNIKKIYEMKNNGHQRGKSRNIHRPELEEFEMMGNQNKERGMSRNIHRPELEDFEMMSTQNKDRKKSRNVHRPELEDFEMRFNQYKGSNRPRNVHKPEPENFEIMGNQNKERNRSRNFQRPEPEDFEIMGNQKKERGRSRNVHRPELEDFELMDNQNRYISKSRNMPHHNQVTHPYDSMRPSNQYMVPPEDNYRSKSRNVRYDKRGSREELDSSFSSDSSRGKDSRKTISFQNEPKIIHPSQNLRKEYLEEPTIYHNQGVYAQKDPYYDMPKHSLAHENIYLNDRGSKKVPTFVENTNTPQYLVEPHSNMVPQNPYPNYRGKPQISRERNPHSRNKYSRSISSGSDEEYHINKPRKEYKQKILLDNYDIGQNTYQEYDNTQRKSYRYPKEGKIQKSILSNGKGRKSSKYNFDDTISRNSISRDSDTSTQRPNFIQHDMSNKRGVSRDLFEAKNSQFPHKYGSIDKKSLINKTKHQETCYF